MHIKRFLGAGPVILTAGFCIRILFALALPSHELSAPSDSYYYDLSANAVLRGEGYHEGNLYAYRPPLYAFFLAGVYRLFGTLPAGYIPLVCIQALLSVATALFVYKTALLALSHQAALAAMASTCFFPTLISLSTELMSETLYLFLITAGIYLTAAAGVHKNLVAPAFAGLLCGLSVLAREITLYFAPVLLVWIICRYKRENRAVAPALLFFAAFLLPLAPWIFRNYRLFASPVITTNGGVNFYMGNNDSATGFFRWDLPEGAVWPATLDPHTVSREALHKAELRVHKQGFAAGLRFIASNPAHFLKLSVKRTTFFWLPPPSDFENAGLTPRGFMGMARSLYTIILELAAATGIVLLLLRRRLHPILLLLLIWIGYTTAFHGAVVVDHRYSLTMVPALSVFAGFGIALGVNRYLRRAKAGCA